MKTQQEEIVDEQSVPDNASAITVDTEDHNKIIRDYQREIYSDIIGSIVRETVSNAIDAHDEAGVDRDVEVALHGGTRKQLGLQQSMFVVRDFGVGMSDEFVREGFSLYRNSTKNDTDELIGGYGIGAKCPLGYTDTFLMDCYYEGTRRRYQLQRHQGGDYLTCLVEEETDRTNGVTVIVPIDAEDTQDFQEACVEQLAYLSPRITFEDKAPTDFELPGVKYETEDFRLLEDSITHGGYQRFTRNAIDNLHVTVGDVPYEVDRDQVEDLSRRAANMNRLCLKFDVGELDLNLPREELRYTDRTQEAITQRLNDARQTMKEEIMESTRNLDFDNKIEKGLTYESIENGNSDNLEDLGFDADAGPAADLYRDLETLGGSPSSPSDNVTKGSFRKISSTYMHSRSHNNERVHSRKQRSVLRHAITSQDASNIYVASIDSDTARNRRIAEKHSTAYVWFLNKEDELFEDAVEQFQSYDDMTSEDAGFERQEYLTTHDDDEIPCYHLTSSSDRGKQCKWSRNYEDTDQIRDAVEDGDRWVWGLMDDKSKLWKAEKTLGHTPEEKMPDDLQHQVVRVSKRNAKRYFKGDHVYVDDLSDWLEERRHFLARDYHTYQIADKYGWMQVFADYPELAGFDRLRRHVLNAVREVDDNHRKRGYAQTIYRSMDSDEIDPWPESKPQIHRLKRYGENLRAIKKAKGWHGFSSSIEKSVLYLLRPIANRMKDVEPIDNSQ